MKIRNPEIIILKIGFTLIALLLVVNTVMGASSVVKPTKGSLNKVDAQRDTGGWEKIVDAAKKEGKVVISGAPGEQWRKSLVDMFQQEYPEINVEYTAVPGRNFWPRIRQERALDKKLWDFRVGGIDPLSIEAKRDGFLAPIFPLLRPEIADETKWIGGMNGLFSDKDKKYLLAYLLYVQPSVYVNRDYIKESELKSSAQLLDHKFRGKIVILTPTGGSSRKSLCNLGFSYGENFLHDLLSKQDVVITDDNRQQAEWVVRGKYPIAVGFSLTLLIPFEKQGLGRNVIELEDKIIRTTTGSGVISLLEGAPHPNAIKVYINWLLSQKTQVMLTKNVQHNSRRIDVPAVETAIDITKLSRYRDSSTEEGIEFDYRYDAIIKEALKR